MVVEFRKRAWVNVLQRFLDKACFNLCIYTLQFLGIQVKDDYLMGIDFFNVMYVSKHTYMYNMI